MKELEKDAAPVSEKQEAKPVTAVQNAAPATETDALLQDLKQVLEISDEEETQTAPKAEEAPSESETPAAEAAATQAEKPEETEAAPASEEKAKAAPAAEEKKSETEPKAEEKFESDGEAIRRAIAESVQKVESAKKAEPAKKAAPVQKAEPEANAEAAAVDDEKLLAELHMLIGDPVKPKPVQSRSGVSPAGPGSPLTAPKPRPVARITPDTLKNVSDDYDELGEADTMGVPGWIKGAFILLLSLLVGAMTLYAVASDLLGEIF